MLVSIGGSYDWPEGGRTHQSPGDVALLDTLPGWTIHVPSHPADVDALLRRAVRRDEPTYIRLSGRHASAPHAAPAEGFSVLRCGSRASVLVVGPLVDRVLEAVAGLDVTVLHAVTVRPFDVATLRATLQTPAVVLVEPYLAGTSAWAVADALADVPHRLLSLGVRRDLEVRRYGDVEDHDQVHGLDASGLRGAISGFLRRTAGLAISCRAPSPGCGAPCRSRRDSSCREVPASAAHRGRSPGRAEASVAGSSCPGRRRRRLHVP